MYGKDDPRFVRSEIINFFENGKARSTQLFAPSSDLLYAAYRNANNGRGEAPHRGTLRSHIHNLNRDLRPQGKRLKKFTCYALISDST